MLSTNLPGGGRWATEKFAAAMAEGIPLSPSILRTCDVLRKDEWKQLDEGLIEEGLDRLRFIADLMALGLVVPITNAMGTTQFDWEDVSEMEDAVVSLDGLARSDKDTLEFDLSSIPLPITHRDFDINLRRLNASRTRGEALDTTKARVAGRKVAEKLEDVGINGGPTYGGNAIFGLTNHPDRNTGGFDSGTAWSASAKTGAQIILDIGTMKTQLHTEGFYGPFNIYIPGNTDTKLDEDYTAGYPKTIRERILSVDSVNAITTLDKLTADNVVMVQMTRDVVVLLNGEGIQTIQWDLYGGFSVGFKAFAIQVPLIRSTQSDKCGVYHMS